MYSFHEALSQPPKMRVPGALLSLMMTAALSSKRNIGTVRAGLPVTERDVDGLDHFLLLLGAAGSGGFDGSDDHVADVGRLAKEQPITRMQ